MYLKKGSEQGSSSPPPPPPPPSTTTTTPGNEAGLLERNQEYTLTDGDVFTLVNPCFEARDVSLRCLVVMTFLSVQVANHYSFRVAACNPGKPSTAAISQPTKSYEEPNQTKWKCGKCTFCNKALASCCKICGKTRSTATVKSSRDTLHQCNSPPFGTSALLFGMRSSSLGFHAYRKEAEALGRERRCTTYIRTFETAQNGT